MRDVDPMNRRAAFHPIRGAGTMRAWQDLGTDQADLARRIRFISRATDDMGPAQAHMAARPETIEFLWRIFHEVVPLDPDFTADGDLAGAGVRVLGMVGDFHLLDAAGWPVFQHHLEWIEHGHAARRAGVEKIPDIKLQQRHVGGAVEFGDTDAFAEMTHGGGRIAAAADAGKGRQSRIIPAADVSFLDELEQLALAHDGITQAEPGELDLARLAWHRAVVDEPIV